MWDVLAIIHFVAAIFWLLQALALIQTLVDEDKDEDEDKYHDDGKVKDEDEDKYKKRKI